MLNCHRLGCPECIHYEQWQQMKKGTFKSLELEECVCGDPKVIGIRHRKDGPCFFIETVENRIKELGVKYLPWQSGIPVTDAVFASDLRELVKLAIQSV